MSSKPRPSDLVGADRIRAQWGAQRPVFNLPLPAGAGSDRMRLPAATPPPEARVQLLADRHRFEVPQAVAEAAGAIGDGWRQLNPCVCVHRGELWTTVRLWNKPTTRNVIARLSPATWQLIDPRPMADLPRSAIMGYEDVRIFSRGLGESARLQACATVWGVVENDPRSKMTVMDLDDDGDVIASHVQPSDRIEKNWMPAVTAEELRFVYAVDPISIVVRYDDEALRVTPEASTLPLTPGSLRGGSQLVPYRFGFLAVVHQVHAVQGQMIYVHRFVRFDRFMQVERVGRPFYFIERSGIEFASGMCAWDDCMLVSFGRDDREAWVAEVDFETIHELLEGRES